jgi:MFS family permease
MKNYTKIAAKITLVLFVAQSLTSAGFIAAATLNSIIGATLGGSPAWAGVPSAVYQLGGALAASLWGVLMDWLGRRKGISLGLLFGVAGAGLVIYSIENQSLIVFLGGMLLMGVANAAITLGRFAAAEVNPPEKRGAAISNVVLGGTFGSIFGPLIVAPAGALVMLYGFKELSGAYAATLVLFIAAALIVFALLTPDPKEIGREMAERHPETVRTGPARPILEILRQPAALTAVAAMVFGQVVMVAVMVITSLHMKQHDHMLSDISMVLSSHTFGMYAFSVISGRLADRWGRARVILIGAGVLLLSCITAPLSPDVLPLAVSLFLLGLGWNFCFVGGSTLLADQLSPDERARTQGTNDLLVGFASALGSLSAGMVFSASGYAMVAAIGAALALVPLVLALRLLLKEKETLRVAR